MTKHTKRIKQTDLDANAPQADNFSWSESQTGTAVGRQGTDGDDTERTVTMLDYMGSPVVTYSIINAWPKKYTGVGLKADSNEVAVEGITLCHEGFDIQ